MNSCDDTGTLCTLTRYITFLWHYSGEEGGGEVNADSEINMFSSEIFMIPRRDSERQISEMLSPPTKNHLRRKPTLLPIKYNSVKKINLGIQLISTRSMRNQFNCKQFSHIARFFTGLKSEPKSTYDMIHYTVLQKNILSSERFPSVRVVDDP